MKSDHRRLLSNFSALFSLEMANKLLPLVTLPYLVRVLGIEAYGLYAFSLALMALLQVFVSFGFDLYATRLVSIHRDDKAYLQRIINSVFIIRLLLACIGFAILFLLTSVIVRLEAYQLFHLLNYLSVIGASLFAIYYFQGTENMKMVTLFNVVAKLIFTAMVFWIVNDDTDLLLLAGLNGLSYLVPVLIAVYVIYYRDGFDFRWEGWRSIKYHLKESLSFFYSRLATSIYSSSTLLVLGAILGDVAAGVFSIAEKLFRAIISLYSIFNQLLYPYIAYRKDLFLYKKVFAGLVVLNAFGVFVLYIISPWLLPYLFGEASHQSIQIMQCLSVALCFSLPAILWGYPLLGAMGYSDMVNRSVVYAALLHLMALLLFHELMGVMDYAYLILATEIVVFSLRLFFVLKTNVLTVMQR